MSSCVNCGLASKSFKKAPCNTFDVQVKLLLEEWVDRSISDDDVICMTCNQLLLDSIEDGDRTRKLGHSKICACCGISVLRKRFKSLPPDHAVAEFILLDNPRKLDALIVCKSCDMRITRKIIKSDDKGNQSPKPKTEKNLGDSHATKEAEKLCLRNNMYDKVDETPGGGTVPWYQNSNSTISLVSYKRAVMNKRNCLIKNCQNNNLTKLPKLIVEMLLVDFNIYVPNRVRICSEHLEKSDWDTVADQMKVSDSFSKEHVEHALDTLKRRRESAVDFESVEHMPDSLCKFLTGLKVAEFMELHDSIQWNFVRSKMGLAILLIKLKRESNDDVIADLLGSTGNVIKTELSKAIKCVREADKAFFNDLDEENLSTKINSSFLSIYVGSKDD